MRLAGYEFRTIADTLGVSVSTAHGYVNDGWDRINELTDDDRRKLRRQMVERINDARVVVMGLICAPGLIVEKLDRLGNVVQEDGALLRLKAIDRMVKLERLHADVYGIKLIAPKDADDLPKQEKFMPLDQLVAMVKDATAPTVPTS